MIQIILSALVYDSEEIVLGGPRIREVWRYTFPGINEDSWSVLSMQRANGFVCALIFRPNIF